MSHRAIYTGYIPRDPELITVDDTGGWGASAIDAMNLANCPNVPINFSGKADDPRYYNKRAEMYFRCAEWIKRGVLPPVEELVAELAAQKYFLHKGRLQLLEKAQIKDEIGRSPDYADALALTFAHVEMPGRPQHAGPGPKTHFSEWNPFEST